MPKSLVAVVLAGSRGAADPVAVAAGVTHKALVSVAGEMMLAHVIKTLIKVEQVTRILVVIEIPEVIKALPEFAPLFAAGRIMAIPAASSPSRSLCAAFAASQDMDTWLLTTADHPLLTVEMIQEFLAKIPDQAEAAVALARKEVIEAGYPLTKRTYLRFRDVNVSGCNLFLFSGPHAERIPRFWVRMEKHRKQPWRMAWEVGPMTVILFLLRRLTLAQVFQRLSAKIGIRACPIDMDQAEAAIDVDKAEDLKLVESILRQRPSLM